MSWSRNPSRAASCSRTARTSATIGSVSIVDLQKFLRGANDRGLESHSTTNGFDSRPEGGVGDMPAVPGREIFDTVDGRDRDMQGIGGCLRGSGTSSSNAAASDSASVVTSSSGISASTRRRSAAATESPAAHSLTTKRETYYMEKRWRRSVHHSCVVCWLAAIRRTPLGCIAR